MSIYEKIRLYADMQELLFASDMSVLDADIISECKAFLDAIDNNDDLSGYINYIRNELIEREEPQTEEDKNDYIKLTRIMLSLEKMNK